MEEHVGEEAPNLIAPFRVVGQRTVGRVPVSRCHRQSTLVHVHNVGYEDDDLVVHTMMV